LLSLSTPLRADGARTYKEKCSLCHDAGATQAPRVGPANDWRARVEKGRAGLVRSALEGVRGSAMLPKAGFPELHDEEIAAAVDYMISTLGVPVPQPVDKKDAPRKPQMVFARVDDRTLVANVAEALRARVAPRATVEGARVAGITVEARDGRVALRGMVDSVQVVREAEDAALKVAGVAAVDNHLIPADLFEHD
jgi:hypothetical protein